MSHARAVFVNGILLHIKRKWAIELHSLLFLTPITKTISARASWRLNLFYFTVPMNCAVKREIFCNLKIKEAEI